MTPSLLTNDSQNPNQTSPYRYASFDLDIIANKSPSRQHKGDVAAAL